LHPLPFAVAGIVRSSLLKPLVKPIHTAFRIVSFNPVIRASVAATNGAGDGTNGAAATAVPSAAAGGVNNGSCCGCCLLDW
jgi:hypothetical protein